MSKLAVYDLDTEKWFEAHPGAQTTVMKCERCGLYYKPSLGHKPANCKVRKSKGDRMKRFFDTVIDRLCKETGYDYDFLVDRYNECMDNNISVIDFVDITLDQNW